MYPWLVWNVLFRLHERAKRHKTYRMLREMEAADRYSAADLHDLRCEKLRDLLEYSYAHVPYVRNIMDANRVKPSDIRGPGDLALLPLMRKADVRRNRESMRSDIAGKLSAFTTGGSTGDPLIFDLAKRRVASRVACRQRTSRWWGVQVGDSEVAIWGAPVELNRQDLIRNLRDRFLVTRLLSAFELSEGTLSRYLDILERGKYRQIFGYPSALYQVCVHAQKQGRNLRRLGIKVAFVTGEVLYPYQRQAIAETLACPVANGYGGRDSALIAHECPQGGMHVLSDAVIVEIIDAHGFPLPPGESGEIVITDLYSHEAPFIRYATGDVATMSARSCACGRALPMLDDIQGRSNDSIVTPDGRVINSLALIYAVREIEGIERFRIYQRGIDSFRVQILRNQNFAIHAEDRIRRAWTQLFRTPVAVSFEYPSELPLDASGKFRHIVSELTAGQSVQPEGRIEG